MVAFPKLEGEAVERRLVSDGAEQEAALGFQIVVLVKRPPALKREIRGVDEIFVKGEAFRVDVVNAVMVAPIDDEHQVRQGVETPAIIDARQAVEITARGDAG